MSVTDELLSNNARYAESFAARCRCRPPVAWPWWPAWTPASTSTGSSA